MGELSSLQALELARVYLKNAINMEDYGILLVLCYNTEVSLSQAKKTTNDHTLKERIARAYIDLSELLHRRGRVVEAKKIYQKAQGLK
jgi:hypothetical protein